MQYTIILLILKANKLHNLNFTHFPSLTPELWSLVYFYLNIDAVPTTNEFGKELSTSL